MENICKLIAAALLLAGCATTQPNSPAACVFDKLAELPLAGSALRPTLKMAIDGKQVNLLLDTGATATLITRTAFERLDLERDYKVNINTAGIGGLKGMSTAQAVKASTVTLAGLNVNSEYLHIVVGNFELSSVAGVAIDGILGQDILGHYDLDMNFPSHVIAFYRPRQCSDGTPPWPGATVNVPRPPKAPGDVRHLAEFNPLGFRSGDPRPFATVEVDGHTLLGLVDTGASSHYLDRAAALGIGVTEEQLAQDRSIQASGASAIKVTAAVHKFGVMRVFDMAWNDQLIVVGELGGHHQMLIGMPILQYRRVWYPQHGAKMILSTQLKIESKP